MGPVNEDSTSTAKGASTTQVGPQVLNLLLVATGQQLGFQSRGFKGAYLSGQENRIQQFHNGIDRYIAEGKAQKDR